MAAGGTTKLEEADMAKLSEMLAQKPRKRHDCRLGRLEIVDRPTAHNVRIAHEQLMKKLGSDETA